MEYTVHCVLLYMLFPLSKGIATGEGVGVPCRAHAKSMPAISSFPAFCHPKEARTAAAAAATTAVATLQKRTEALENQNAEVEVGQGAMLQDRTGL